MTPRRRDPSPEPVAVRSMLRRLVARREAVRRDSARALVDHEQVRAAVRDQRRRLDDARAEIAGSLTALAAAAAHAAADAAAEARAEGRDPAAAATAAAQPYEAARRGIEGQAATVDAAAAQLATLAGATDAGVDRDRAALQASLRALDDAIRTQVALLVAVEKAERARAVSRAAERGPAGSAGTST